MAENKSKNTEFSREEIETRIAAWLTLGDDCLLLHRDSLSHFIGWSISLSVLSKIFKPTRPN